MYLNAISFPTKIVCWAHVHSGNYNDLWKEMFESMSVLKQGILGWSILEVSDAWFRAHLVSNFNSSISDFDSSKKVRIQLRFQHKLVFFIPIPAKIGNRNRASLVEVLLHCDTEELLILSTFYNGVCKRLKWSIIYHSSGTEKAYNMLRQIEVVVGIKYEWCPLYGHPCFTWVQMTSSSIFWSCLNNFTQVSNSSPLFVQCPIQMR